MARCGGECISPSCAEAMVPVIESDVFALTVRRQVFIAESNLQRRLAFKLMGKLRMLRYQHRVLASRLGQAFIDGQWLESVLAAGLVDQCHKLRLARGVELWRRSIGRSARLRVEGRSEGHEIVCAHVRYK